MASESLILGLNELSAAAKSFKSDPYLLCPFTNLGWPLILIFVNPGYKIPNSSFSYRKILFSKLGIFASSYENLLFG